jgi:CelD/BcsL family acetyltransferase involved in cellulose biosynthesis
MDHLSLFAEPQASSSPAAEVEARGKREQRRPGRWRGDVKLVGDLAEREIALWDRLVASRYELRSPYFSLEFARAVAAGGARVRVCVLYDDGALAGFFPFQFADRIAQSMAAGERIGGALNDFCGVIVDRDRHGSIEPADLLCCAGLGSFEVNHMEETQPALGLRCGAESKGARIKLAGDLDSYWHRVKSEHPSDFETLRRRERKIQRQFRSVEFVFAHGAPQELLPLVVAEKRRQFERTGVADGFAEPWKLRCLERIACHREGRCLPVLSSLFFDGDWAALHFGVRAGSVLHYAFPVYNTKFAAYSPGLILLAKMIRAAPESGITEIDLAEGLSRYKIMLGNELYSSYRDVWYRPTVAGLVYRAYLSLRWRLDGMQKRWSSPISGSPLRKLVASTLSARIASPNK